MISIGTDTLADIFFQVRWDSAGARHMDAYAVQNFNFWRDLLPDSLKQRLDGKQPGDDVSMDFNPGELLTNGERQKVMELSRRQFAPGRRPMPPIIPRVGRFYPKGFLKDVGGIFRNNQTPFRIVGNGNDRMMVDMGHPLANSAVRLSLTVGSVRHKPEERGGTLHDWVEIITSGVGMQARWEDVPTDFFSGEPYGRTDEKPDLKFYEQPRFVDHMDVSAIEMVRQIYGRFVKDGGRVLDLMSSWKSHLPENVAPQEVIGLGLNREELSKNSALTEYVVQDLNQNHRLPFSDASFDTIVCTASIEYLIAPNEIFKEAARILNPGGSFVITFTNRWFPPKAIRIWSELSEFERMGFVLELFRRSEVFTDLQTYSIRGLERPRNDKYYGKYPFADPVYAVWGKKG